MIAVSQVIDSVSSLDDPNDIAMQAQFVDEQYENLVAHHKADVVR